MKPYSIHVTGLRAALLSSALSVLALPAAYGQQSEPATRSSDGQASEANEFSELREVTVTARRVEESAQRVPIAITAVTSDELEKQQIYDARSLMIQIPGLQQATRIPGNPVPTSLTRIRGVSGIATYFDDAPYPSAQWSFYAPFFDIEQVQVLKGPQGTLFGQASNAGAILVQPRRPREEFSGSVTAEVGNYNRRGVEAAVDVPIVADRVFLRLAGKTIERDGWAHDIFSNARVGKEDYDVERATLVVKARDTLQNETMLQFEHVRDLGQVVFVPNDYDFQAQNSAYAPSVALNSRQAALNGMTLAQWNAARDLILAQQASIGPYHFQGWSQGCPASALSVATPSTIPGPDVNHTAQGPCGPGAFGYAKTFALVDKTTWDFATGFAVKNIFSHTTGGNNVFAVDLDGSRLIFQDGNSRGTGLWQNYPTTSSDELQMTGKLFDDRLDFVTGAFWYQQKQGIEPNPTWAINNSSTATNNATTNRTWAAYGQGNFKITDRLTFTGGLRYTHDYAFAINWLVDPNTLQIAKVLSGGPGTPAGEASWKAVSYTAGLQFQLDPHTMLYLTNAKGYSAGGLQNVPGFEKFDPDSLNNIELGVKSTFRLGEDWLARTNLSGFYGFYDNVKVTTGFFTNIPGTTATQVVIATRNAATARIDGVELEAQAAFRDLFNLDGWVSYVHNYYTDFMGVNPQTNQTVDLSNSPFPNSPPRKYGLSATFHLPIDRSRFGDVSLGAQYTYTSMYWVTYGKPQIPAIPGDPDTGAICRAPRTAANGYGPLAADGRMVYKDCAPALDNLNLTLSWTNPMGRTGVEALLTVTNVTGNDTPMGISSGYDTANFNSAYPNFPRMIYGSLKYNF